MTRVLVVSRNPAMAMGLSATDHDIVDLKPPTFGDWIAGPDDVDALVLDLESPALAAAAVVNLRAHGKLAPALLVSSDSPGWDAPELRDLITTSVLQQPVTRATLLTALDEMLTSVQASDPHSEPFIPDLQPVDEIPLNTAEALSELRRADDEDARPDRSDGPDGQDEIERLIVDPRPPIDDLPRGDEAIPAFAAEAQASAAEVTVPRKRRRAPTRAEPHVAEAPEEYTLSAVPRTRRTTPTTQPTRTTSSKVLDDLDRLRSSPSEPAQPRQKEPGAHVRPRQRSRKQPVAPRGSRPVQKAEKVDVVDPADLVRRLTSLTDDLYGVPETAQVVIADAVDRVAAGAGALLCPDDGGWRVSGGVTLRPLEHRIVLQGDAWLIQEVAEGGRGIIIEDTDIARDKLRGSPLASWRQLMAAPVPDIKGVLVLAREGDTPFTEEELGVVAALGGEAAPLLKAALGTRDLARRLAGFEDYLDRER